MDKSPMRFGLYFLDGKLSSGRGQHFVLELLEHYVVPGPTLKMVLCKVAPGKSMCRMEEDASCVTKCPSG